MVGPYGTEEAAKRAFRRMTLTACLALDEPISPQGAHVNELTKFSSGGNLVRRYAKDSGVALVRIQLAAPGLSSLTAVWTTTISFSFSILSPDL